jgi:hypothetical protein
MSIAPIITFKAGICDFDVRRVLGPYLNSSNIPSPLLHLVVID